MARRMSNPTSTSFKPNGWDQLYSTYAEFDGADGYYESSQQKFDIDDFSGCNSASSGADGFHANIALHTTMHNDVCQGRNPIRTLTATAFSHGLFVANHNNTASALHDITHFKSHLFSLYSEKISFIKHTDIANIPFGKILKGIQFCAYSNAQHNIDTTPGFHTYTNQDELEKFIELKLAALKLITPETPQERKNRMDDFLKNFRTKLQSSEYQKQQDAFDDALSHVAMQKTFIFI